MDYSCIIRREFWEYLVGLEDSGRTERLAEKYIFVHLLEDNINSFL